MLKEVSEDGDRVGFVLLEGLGTRNVSSELGEFEELLLVFGGFFIIFFNVYF